MILEEFVKKTLELLELERDAEIEETRILHEKTSLKELERRGIGLVNLRILNRAAGLYGRVTVTFEPFSYGKDLPSNNFSPGDVAGLSLAEFGMKELLSGVVLKSSQTTITVAFNDSSDVFDLDDTLRYKLMKLSNDVTYKRLKLAINDLNHYRSGPSSHLIDIFFNNAELSEPLVQLPNASPGGDELLYFNDKLDDSQRDAVKFALCQREVAIIHGPPGTGKTTTIIEVILQAVKLKQKILACAPSNIAVDNLVEHLAGNKVKIVRIGHPARIVHSIQKYSLDAILCNSEKSMIVEDVRKDLDANMLKFKNAKKENIHKLRQENKALKKELHEREKDATMEILNQADVVLATLTSASSHGVLQHIKESHFDLIVIDECSQAVEAACWIALLYGPKCIIAGDHHQLPPTIVSHEAATKGLQITLMERLIQAYGEKITCMLTHQYRMNKMIMQWSSNTFYDGKLTADISVAEYLLRDLPGVNDDENTSIPLLLIDTAGCNLFELELPDEVSKGNEGEADLVAFHVSKLVTSGVKPSDIAVIAPYNLQVDLVRLRLREKYPSLEIKSVDGFQGREQEAVIISLVRSNSQGEVGFLAEDRRLNVAITRAKRHLVVICDSTTICHHKFLKELIEYLNDHGEIRTAHEYLNDENFGCEKSRPEHLQFKTLTSTAKNRIFKENKNTGTKTKLTKKVVNKLPAEKITTLPIASNDNEIFTAQITNQIKTFLASSSEKELKFSSNLSSYQRKIIHEIAATLGVNHVSKGEGENRFLCIYKKDPPLSKCVSKETMHAVQTDRIHQFHQNTEIKVAVSSLKKLDIKDTYLDHLGTQDASLEKLNELEENFLEKLDTDTESIDTEKLPSEKLSKNDIFLEKLNAKNSENAFKKNFNQCKFCKKPLEQNLELHEVHCGKKQKTESSDISKNKKSQSKERKKQKTLENKMANEEDFDKLLTIVKKNDQTCSFPKCKTSVVTIFQKCKFCLKTFCLSHHIPEVHGCGDAARAHARKLISKGVLYPGSGVPEKKLDPVTRNHLHRKLNSKITEMAQQRQPKKKEEKK